MSEAEDNLNVLRILETIEESCDEDAKKKCEEIRKIIQKIDLSAIESDDCDNTSPGKNEKHLVEMKKQIDLIKKVLSLVHDMQSDNINAILSKSEANGERSVLAFATSVTFSKLMDDSARMLPLWVDVEDGKPPPLCGAIEPEENYIANEGDLVAAYDKAERFWMLGEIINYDPEKQEYIVDDIYERKKSVETVSLNHVLPLPKYRVDPKLNPELLFNVGESVLALYPGTTCFYPAVVMEHPETHEDAYKMQFENEENISFNLHEVHQRFVIQYNPEDSGNV